MISKKYFLADGSTTNFLSDYIIKNDEYCRVYVSDSYELPISAEDRAALLANVSQWELVNNNVVFYEAPAAGKYVTVWVASTPEELDTYIDYAFITYDNIANIETVVDNMDSITTVAGDTTSINTIITNLADINTVAAIDSAISAVADINTEVVEVADIKQEIINVESNSADISTVATYNADVSIVSGSIGNVQSVASNETNINTVATNIDNVNIVGTNISDVNDVADNIADINDVQDNLTVINEVQDNLTAINTVATNVTDVTNFADIYYGAATSAPSTRKDGSALQIGDLYFNTQDDAMKVYSSTGWINAGSSINGTVERFRYVATEGQTTFTGADAANNTLSYDSGFIDVYLNGIHLLPTEYTATSGTSVVFSTGLSAGDEVYIVGFGTFSVAEFNSLSLATVVLPNLVVNGGMDVSQRGSTPYTLNFALGNNQYNTCDRWLTNTSVAYDGIVTYGQNLNSITPPAGFDNYIGFQMDSAAIVAPEAYCNLRQIIPSEIFRQALFGTSQAKTITISFWARSSETGNFPVSIRSDNNRHYVSSYTITSANTWEKHSVTIAGDTSGTWSGCNLNFALGNGSNWHTTLNTWGSSSNTSFSGAQMIGDATGATWYITGVQLNIGEVASLYDNRDPAVEKALCNRFYQEIDTVVGDATTYQGQILSTEMRSTPAITGGGTGFTVANASTKVLNAYQTTKGYQTIKLDAEITIATA